MKNTSGVNYDYKRMRTEMRPLSEDCNSNPAGSDSYLRFYGFGCTKEGHKQDAAGIEYHIGTFESHGRRLAAYIFKPAQYKATVIILHGYLNHSGLMRRMADYLLEQGYAVAMFDLPGHGFSEGKRAAIEDFSEYGSAVRDFLAVIKKDVHGPYDIVAHSTGATAVMENLFTDGDDSFDKVVLVAPLVRCGFWRPVQGLQWVFSPFGGVPRVFVKNSSDWEYLSFIQFKDPMQAKTIPVKWIRAMNQWAKQATQYSAVPRQVKIIQGSRDMTVDWRYNVGFIRDKFARVDVTMVEGGDHELLNESEAIRSKVYEYIREYLHD